LQELEEETKALKQQLLSITPATPSTGPVFTTPPAFSAVGDAAQPSVNDVVASPLDSEHRPNPNDVTESRLLDGLEVGPLIIDDCFGL
jgi:hypothetical protein